MSALDLCRLRSLQNEVGKPVRCVQDSGRLRRLRRCGELHRRASASRRIAASRAGVNSVCGRRSRRRTQRAPRHWPPGPDPAHAGTEPAPRDGRWRQVRKPSTPRRGHDQMRGRDPRRQIGEELRHLNREAYAGAGGRDARLVFAAGLLRQTDPLALVGGQEPQGLRNDIGHHARSLRPAGHQHPQALSGEIGIWDLRGCDDSRADRIARVSGLCFCFPGPRLSVPGNRRRRSKREGSRSGWRGP